MLCRSIFYYNINGIFVPVKTLKCSIFWIEVPICRPNSLKNRNFLVNILPLNAYIFFMIMLLVITVETITFFLITL